MVSPLSGLLVRPLTPADSALLSEALYHSLYTSPGEPPLPRELLLLPELARYTESWGQRFGDQGMLAWRTPQTSIGAAWLRLFSHDAPGYGYVDDLTPELVVSVQPAWRGFGVGTQLILATLEQARPQFPAVSLSVTPGNPAVRLYERLGFEIVHVGPNDITMRYSL